MAKDRVAELKV